MVAKAQQLPHPSWFDVVAAPKKTAVQWRYEREWIRFVSFNRIKSGMGYESVHPDAMGTDADCDRRGLYAGSVEKLIGRPWHSRGTDATERP